MSHGFARTTAAAVLVLCTAFAIATPSRAVLAQSSPASQASAGRTSSPALADLPTAAQPRLDALIERSRERPADLDLLYELALAAVAVEDYESAISALERILILNPNAPRVRLELGVLYFRLGSYDIARAQLERVRDTPDLPDEVRTRVDSYLQAINRETSTSVVTGEVTSGVRRQTNPSAASDPTGVQIGPFLARTENGDGADTSGFLSGQLNHIYRFDNQYDDAWSSRLDAYGELYRSHSDLDVSVINLETGPEIGLARFGLGDTRLRPFAQVAYITLDREFYQSSGGGGLELRRAVGLDLELRIRGRARYAGYTDTEENPERDRTGWRQDIGFGATWRLLPLTVLDGFAYIERARADGQYRAYAETGAIGQISQLVDLPERFVVGPILVSAGGSIAHAEYRAPDPVIEPTQTRDEWTYTARGGVTLGLPRGLAIVTEVEHRWVNSNIGIYGYDNTAFTAGLRFRF